MISHVAIYKYLQATETDRNRVLPLPGFKAYNCRLETNASRCLSLVNSKPHSIMYRAEWKYITLAVESLKEQHIFRGPSL